MREKVKVIWITGASSGIGKAIALSYANADITLILSARNREALNKVAQECMEKGASTIVEPLDLADSISIESAIKFVYSKVSHVDLLINNGGLSQRAYAQETDISVDRKIMEVNFFGTVQLTKSVLSKMLERGEGHLAVVTSIVGKFGFPLRTSYSASKHALQGYFESLRTEVEKQGIDVSIIIPGRIATEISKHALSGDGKSHNKQDESLAAGMDVDEAAQDVRKGLEKRKREILVGKKELLMVHIRRLWPGLYYRMIGNIKET